jgi:hypothetical protein
MHACVRLMPEVGDSQVLVEAILDLFKNIATTLFIFVDLKISPDAASVSEDGDNFFNLLYALFENYKLSQMRRFRTSSALAEIEEEEQISDLVTLLQTIGSSISKPYMIFTTPGDATDNSAMPLCQKSSFFNQKMCKEFYFSSRNDSTSVE